MCDVQLVAHSQAPHFPPDTWRDALPPEVSHSPGGTPADRKDKNSGWFRTFFSPFLKNPLLISATWGR